MHKVILNNGPDTIPPIPNTTDLNNKTTLAEAIGILANANGYYGIDSCLAVLAAQLFQPNQIKVKSINTHYMKSAHIYAAPHGKKIVVPSMWANL